MYVCMCVCICIYMFHKVTFDWCLSQLVVAVRLWSMPRALQCVFKNKKHHWDKDLSVDNNPLYVCLVKEKFKQQFDALKSRRNKHFPVFLSRISPSLNSARMRIFCDASTNRRSKSLYSHRKIDYFNTCKKNGRRRTCQLKSPSWITVWGEKAWCYIQRVWVQDCLYRWWWGIQRCMSWLLGRCRP